jgi:hypothetical protein
LIWQLLTCNPQTSTYFHHIEKWILTPSAIDQSKVGIGDETFTVGRFISHEVSKKSPSVRFGNISMMPYEPVRYKGRTHDAFLIEAGLSWLQWFSSFVHILPYTARPTDATYEPEKLLEKMLISYHVWLLELIVVCFP